jgi:hypothetical protein
LRSGSVTVNGLIVDYKMPFGGFKQSGIGREGGIEGLENYFEVKTVYFGYPRLRGWERITRILYSGSPSLPLEIGDGEQL